MTEDCLACSKIVRPRQEALRCDGCDRWQHRICGTGITRDQYRATVRGDEDGIISWYCRDCTNPALNSTDEESFGEPPVLEPFTAAANSGSHIRFEEIKTLASTDVFRPAMEIVESTYREQLRPDDFAMAKPVTMKRIANRHRQSHRPREPEPQDILFEINTEFLGDGFVQREVEVDHQRHIVFATDTQLRLLRESRRWFVDGTFKITRRPFVQLWSIHSFIHKDDGMKQVPLAFILMTRRQKDDYVEILQAIRALVRPAVQAVVMDFESAAWTAFREVFPGIQVKGCVFHWVQCIWRKVQNLGLQATYTQRQSVHQYVRKLMAIPFLPHQHMRPSFENLRRLANTPPLLQLVDYMEQTWFSSSVFTTESVSVYKLGVRTNNDVEGWHRRINRRANGSALGFYSLVPLLRQEAEYVNLQVRLVQDLLYSRDNRRRYCKIQKQLDKLWDSYADGDISTNDLLTKTSRLYGEFY